MSMTPTQQQHLRDWCIHAGITLCVLFGSRATNQARPDSDYDLAISPQPTPQIRLMWQIALEELLQGNVDIVILAPTTEPTLGWEIARTGYLIYATTPDIWATERAKLWHRYNDALPFRRSLSERQHKDSPRVT